MDIGNKNLSAMSDPVLLKNLGSFIKQQRLEQNKTQLQLATEAGINRTTLSLFEKGENISLMIFIQLLRALKLLHLLDEFQTRQQISPIQLAKLEKSTRLRAVRAGKIIPKPKSEW